MSKKNNKKNNLKINFNSKDVPINNNINTLLFSFQKRITKLEQEGGGVIPEDLNVKSITSTSGTINTLSSTDATINTLTSTNGNINTLTTTDGTINTLTTTTGNIQTITSENINSEQININKIVLNEKELNSVKIVEDVSEGNDVIASVAYVDSVASGGSLDNYYTKAETNEILTDYVQKTDNSIITLSNQNNQLTGDITTTSLKVNNKEIIDIIQKNNVETDDENKNKKLATVLKIEELINEKPIDLSNYIAQAIFTNKDNEFTAKKINIGPNQQNLKEIIDTTAQTSTSDDKILATKKYVDEFTPDLSHYVRDDTDATLLGKIILNNSTNEIKTAKIILTNYKEINATTALSSSTYDDDKILATKKYVDESEIGKHTANNGEIFNDYEHNIASNNFSHAEGSDNTASGISSHAEGSHTVASGNYSHTEGNYTLASANQSHASGLHTIANKENMFVVGKYNKDGNEENENKLFVVGNGNGITGDDNEKSDAFVVKNTGDVIVNNNLSTNSLTLNNNQLIDIIKSNEVDLDNKNKKIYSALKVDELINSAGIDLSHYEGVVNISNTTNQLTAQSITLSNIKVINDLARNNDTVALENEDTTIPSYKKVNTLINTEFNNCVKNNVSQNLLNKFILNNGENEFTGYSVSTTSLTLNSNDITDIIKKTEEQEPIIDNKKIYSKAKVDELIEQSTHTLNLEINDNDPD